MRHAAYQNVNATKKQKLLQKKLPTAELGTCGYCIFYILYFIIFYNKKC